MAWRVELIDVTTIATANLESYWVGNDSVLHRFGAPDLSEVPPGKIHAIVIDVHPLSRDTYPNGRDGRNTRGESNKDVHEAPKLVSRYAGTDFDDHGTEEMEIS